MTKEEFIKTLEDKSQITELNKNNAYLIQVEVEESMVLDEVVKYLKMLADTLKSYGLTNFLIGPMHKGKPLFSVKDLQEALKEGK